MSPVKKALIVIHFVLFAALSVLYAQKPPESTYVVYFKNKTQQLFDPYTYFDSKAIQRRINNHLPLADYRDFPVDSSYINTIERFGISTLVVSRWLNAMFIKCDEQVACNISKFPFVKSVDRFANSELHVAEEYSAGITSSDSLFMYYQTDRFKGALLRNAKLTGKGIRIAVFDVGFNGVNTHPAFKHIYQSNHVVNTYDFVGKCLNVYHGGSHGTHTLSCIAGKADSVNLGMAPEAEFLLARTEWDKKEKKQEEYFWLAAAEWADKNGASIISSSLGYSKPLYEVKDMDGHKSVTAFAATIAAQKGILVINSAGNEFENSWKSIITPADADSVLCIGGISPLFDRQIYFSSRGPSADFRLKPNLSAPAVVIVANPKGGLQQTQGTSFSCPLVSGFAACAWQIDTTLTNMQLFKRLEQSGSLFPYYDYMHGYGVPQASVFCNSPRQIQKPTFSLMEEGLTKKMMTITFNDSAIIERIREASNNYESSTEEETTIMNNNKVPGLNLYWKVQSPSGKIKHYRVIAVHSTDPIVIKPKDFDSGDEFVIHFEGFTQTVILH